MSDTIQYYASIVWWQYATSSQRLIFDLSTKEPVVIVSSSSPLSNPNSNKHTKVKKKRKGANAAALLHSEEICPSPVVLQESESVQSGGIIIVDNVEDTTNDYIDLKQVEEDEPTFDDQVVSMFCGLCLVLIHCNIRITFCTAWFYVVPLDHSIFSYNKLHLFCK